MGCGKGFETGNCVCDILKDIVDAQTDVVENCCDTSCEQSISDLLGERDSGNGLDTVPVILYCKDSCKPFKGYGAHPNDIGHMTSSFFFRVKSVDKDCCATLELLRDPNDADKDPKSPVHQCTEPLLATGICLTVDLNCFCHVTCLPAVNAL
ncbi:spore coat protein Z [Virgibacillus natechei]|uniref:Spore coat protein Z n=1 Tax=Virgibacillus natechei TaxID=1216297 RepID=A0ABS4IF20_9BACI|nr:CotY/CotZ family spore coat protein [Virgibacillus natechei]MBP1969056.1 spore coat protein Z [Virgibacillus natechei]UZD14326.1 CotY/CotZ family spore coat protein [Virgibacillus natechei]